MWDLSPNSPNQCYGLVVWMWNGLQEEGDSKEAQ